MFCRLNEVDGPIFRGAGGEVYTEGVLFSGC